MKSIEQLIREIDNFSTCVIHKRFKSKKNNVALITNNGSLQVIKLYAENKKANMKKEIFILQKTDTHLKTPGVKSYNFKNNYLLMEYISGVNACDYINDDKISFQEKQTIMVQLADWFSSFHTFFKKQNISYLRGDAILRNFIITSGTIYGVDFEEATQGHISEDIATFCASIITTHPVNTYEKERLCNLFLSKYQIKMSITLDNIESQIQQEINKTLKRRIKKG